MPARRPYAPRKEKGMAWIIVGGVVGLIFLCLFAMPLWVIWTVEQLWGVDWHSKYWAVWSLVMIIGLMQNSGYKGGNK